MTRNRWLDSVRLVNNLYNRRKLRGGCVEEEEKDVDVVVNDDDIDVDGNDGIDAGVDNNSSLLPPTLPQQIEVSVEEDGDPPGVKWSSALIETVRFDPKEDDDEDDDNFEEDMKKIERDFGGCPVPPFRQERGHQERRESHVSILSLFP